MGHFKTNSLQGRDSSLGASESRRSFEPKRTILPTHTILFFCRFDLKKTILVKADDSAEKIRSLYWIRFKVFNHSGKNYLLVGVRPNFKIIGNFRKTENLWPVYKASKMTPTDEFWVRRCVPEPRYRLRKRWNFRLRQLPLIIIFFQNFFLYGKDPSKLHR